MNAVKKINVKCKKCGIAMTIETDIKRSEVINECAKCKQEKENAGSK